MEYIFTGSIAFILFFLFDYYKLKNFNSARNAASITGLILFLYSLVMTGSSSPKLHFPVLVHLISVFLLAVSIVLLIYSLFLELPFRATYNQGNENNSLVVTGTYALCRHPGVLWLFLSLIFTFFITGAIQVAAAAIIWTSINSLYVFLQEKLFFCRMFPGYKEYQRRTPMLIPNSQSMKKCIESFSIGGFCHGKLRKHD